MSEIYPRVIIDPEFEIWGPIKEYRSGVQVVFDKKIRYTVNS